MALGNRLRCTKEPYIEDVGPRRIESIQFDAFSGEEVRKLSEVQVFKPLPYNEKLEPMENGLLDPRMGPANKRGKCKTCFGDFTDCPGHFGWLPLALPVYNVGYFSNILNVLKCICKSCARILLPEQERKAFLRKMRSQRADVLMKNALMKKVRDRCKPARCLRCGFENGTVKKAKSILAISHEFNRKVDKSLDECRPVLSEMKGRGSLQMFSILSPVTVLSLFKRMPDEDCELLNLYGRPEKFLVTDIAVPPVPVRPSAFVGFGNQSNENDLTSILRNILSTNSLLRSYLQSNDPPYKCLECTGALDVLWRGPNSHAKDRTHSTT